MTKHGVLLLKEKGSEASGVHPFDVAMVPPLLIRIQDSLLREALCKEYKKVTKQARNTMMALYLECAEKQQRQYQIDYDATVKEMVPSGQKFSRSMNHLLHKRLENINACIACEYKFQIALVRLKSQTR